MAAGPDEVRRLLLNHVITTQLLLRHPLAGVTRQRGRWSRGRCRVDFFARHHRPSNTRCSVRPRDFRDLRWLALQELRHPGLAISVFCASCASPPSHQPQAASVSSHRPAWLIPPNHTLPPEMFDRGVSPSYVANWRPHRNDDPFGQWQPGLAPLMDVAGEHATRQERLVLLRPVGGVRPDA